MNGAFQLGVIAAAARVVAVGPAPSPTDTYFDRVEALLHMEGSDGSTTFIDSSLDQKTCTAANLARIKTDQKAFGSSSAYFDGNTLNYVSIGTASQFDFLTQQVESWTIEGWIRPADVSGVKGILTKGSNNQTESANLLVLNGANVFCLLYKSSTYGSVFASQGGISALQWAHVAACFDASDRTLRVAVNGAVSAPTTVPAASEFATLNGRQALLGRYYEATLPFTGHIDELRITRGVARYLSNFTPPSAPFADAGPLVLKLGGSAYTPPAGGAVNLQLRTDTYTPPTSA